MYMILICVYFTMYWVRDDLINEFNQSINIVTSLTDIKTKTSGTNYAYDVIMPYQDFIFIKICDVTHSYYKYSRENQMSYCVCPLAN